MAARVGAVLAAATLASGAATPPRCADKASTSLLVQWDPVADTDLYYVALSETPTARPFALRTTANTTLSVIDLAPGTTYHVSLRSHPAAEPTIAWAPGWRALSPAVACTTAPAPAVAAVRRAGELTETSVSLTFEVDPAGPLALLGPHVRWDIGVLRAPSFEAAETAGAWGVPEERYGWAPARAVPAGPGVAASVPGRAVLAANVTGLQPASTYFVVVRAVVAGPAERGDGGAGGAQTLAVSDAEVFRTRAPGMLYTVSHRISEYAEDVDFLENHDSASIEAMPLYLMTCSPEGNCQPWNKTQFTKTDAEWDSCEAALAQICPGHRGTGFNGCVECVDAHHDAVVKACGNYTDADKMHPGYPVHYYCGVGWPENLMYFSAITEHCVEHLPAPDADPRWGGGFAQYISCNSDETDAAWNNSARDPTCMCWVHDDRAMSLLPASELNKSCSGNMPWYVHESICNCTSAKTFPESTAITPDNPSYRYVGAMPTFLPWGYYQKPLETYPVRKPMGFNFAFPKAGSCLPGQRPGDGGCTWLRHPLSRMIYGPDLFGAGWDDRWIPDTLTNFSHTLYNVGVFDKTTHLRDHLVTRRCCGC